MAVVTNAQPITNEQLKVDILTRLQEKVRGFTTVKGDITEAFQQWFQGLIIAGQMAQTPQQPSQEEEQPSPTV